jgi:hypothetical protein
MTWEQYMDKARITQPMYDMGKEFLRRIFMNYEQVPGIHFETARDEDLLNNAAQFQDANVKVTAVENTNFHFPSGRPG